MAYTVERWTLLPLYSLWVRKVEGIGNVPKNKPFIIVANHTSYFDALLLPSIIIPILNKNMKSLVNSYYWNNPITRFFLNLWGGIPVYVGREKGARQKNEKSLEIALNSIKNGEVLMMFPEGKRSPDGKLQKAYTGVARLALMSRAPVLPCGIRGADEVLPIGKTFPRFVRCKVKIGQLMHFQKYYNRKITKNALEKITRSIMEQIARLSNQKYNY